TPPFNRRLLLWRPALAGPPTRVHERSRFPTTAMWRATSSSPATASSCPKAMLVVAGPRSPNAGELVPMTFDAALAGSGLAAVSISGDIANAIFRGAGKTLEEAQKSLDSANPHVAGFAIPGITAKVHAAVVREKKTGNNIVAYLPATEPVGTMARPWVAIGAHYDHLGHGEAGNTLAGKEDAGKVHHGADDNASGAAAVLAVASTLAGQPRKRHL